MPDLPISQLPEIITGISQSAEFVIVQNGVTSKIKESTLNPFPKNYGFFSQTSDSPIISGTTAESTIIGNGVGTLIVPPNTFKVGDSFSVAMGGLLSSRNNDTLRVRVKSGPVILGDSGNQILSSSINDVFKLSVDFTIRSLGGPGVASLISVGVFQTTKQSNNTPAGFAFNTVNSTTFDTTITNTLDITAEFSSSNSLNSIYTDVFVLNKIY